MTFAGHRSRRGFTLVELMIVVVIVGILATMAVVGYRKMVAESHSSEAIQVLSSIRVAQEAMHAETGQYDDISANLCTDPACSSLYPQAFYGGLKNAVNTSWVVGNFKVGWGGAGASCGAECQKWLAFPVHSPGAVYHGFSTKAGLAGTTPPATTLTCTPGSTSTNVSITWPTTANAQDWFVVTAIGDVDGDGVAATYMTSSFNNDVTSVCEGE